MKKIFSVVILFAAIIILINSCKKDNGSSGKKVQYKAFTSSNAKISHLAYIYGNGSGQSVTNVNATTWQSDEMIITSPVITITVDGTTNDLKDNTGKLTVQILVDGKVAKEGVSNGNILSTTVTLN